MRALPRCVRAQSCTTPTAPRRAVSLMLPSSDGSYNSEVTAPVMRTRVPGCTSRVSSVASSAGVCIAGGSAAAGCVRRTVKETDAPPSCVSV